MELTQLQNQHYLCVFSPARGSKTILMLGGWSLAFTPAAGLEHTSLEWGIQFFIYGFWGNFGSLVILFVTFLVKGTCQAPPSCQVLSSPHYPARQFQLFLRQRIALELNQSWWRNYHKAQGMLIAAPPEQGLTAPFHSVKVTQQLLGLNSGPWVQSRSDCIEIPVLNSRTWPENSHLQNPLIAHSELCGICPTLQKMPVGK